MNSLHEPSPSSSPVDPPSIVSVNSRGGAATGAAAKVAFGLLVVGLVAIGCLFGFNKHRATQQQEEKAAELIAKAGAGPVAATPRRIFDTDPPAPPATSAASPPSPSPACQDGSIAQLLLGPDGRAIPGPSGEPMRVCQDGHLFVSGLLPIPGQQPPANGAQPAAAQVPATTATPRSRYGGDVVLAQTGGAASGTPATDAAGQSSLYSLQQARSIAVGDVQREAHDAASRVLGRDSRQQGDIGSQLTGTPTSAVWATMIGDRDMVIPQGRSIDCNLSIRLINEVSGKATCVVSSNVYSDSGRVVLAERGSTATGEYVAMMAQGQRRLFVLWTRLQTPTGVVIDINSPAADSLGTSGLAGDIDNRWRDRIGAAVLLSLVEDAIGYQTAKASSGGGGGGGGAEGIAVFKSSTETGRNLAERILNNTINIKPTLYKNQGDRATIFVSRDLDFGRVYALRAK
jgi:type IV secretion system protein VirB10